MKRFLKLSVLALSASLVGCAVPVYDNHQEDPAPFWWPAFMYKPSTRPSQQEYDQTRNYPTHDAPDADFAGAGGAWIDPVSGVATGAKTQSQEEGLQPDGSQRDVRAEWNLAYAQHPIIVDTAEAPAVPSVNPAASTVYPNRGQAAVASGSATLYPPTNEFNSGPTRTASVYPHGPLAPTGYVGR